MRRVLLTVVGGVVAAAAVVGSILAVVGTWQADAGATDCSEQLAAGQATVHTDRRWTEADIPGVGSYPEIHWQTQAAGNPCSRAPGPTDWRYQGVIRLRPEDATALADRYDWRPVPAVIPSYSEEYEFETPNQMWPALVPFVPDGTRWLHSRTWTETHSQGTQWTDLYLAPDQALAFVVLYDH
ncbi:hypothetical protein GCM10010112_92450 [Actinoplanes lobatus]|uniref:Uncharacterized protein n=1 Tax=Actinoplanes lobatus TaxID=113568 RepID=A0A7W7MJ95_9ACTN|nr:hypothetical protein [Actinoplanes lobatus]MBB4751815.1 hypothetical protein [Actinoplanes lobatus]GGN99027.1 hypothetical protein GCM10010112_92450 [Actinoplanes lobatus]GIE46259.1 hypothetical protein Alo02nite_91570 [Actinoplanes lobatus]